MVSMELYFFEFGNLTIKSIAMVKNVCILESDEIGYKGSRLE